MGQRSALLIRCSKHEADEIRTRAGTERRTISQYFLNIVLRSIDREETFEGRWLSNPSYRTLSRDLHKDPLRKVGPRTALLLRCSIEDAERIRAAARRRQIMISEYVLHCVRRTFKESH